MLDFKKIVLGLIAVAVSGSAFALPTMKLSSGADSFIVTDNDLVNDDLVVGNVSDLNSDLGVLLFDGSVGAYDISINAGFTKPATADNFIDLLFSALNTGPTGGDALTLEFSETGFTTLPVLDHFVSSIGGTTQGTVTFDTYVDDSNTLFGTGIALADMSFGGPSFSDSQVDGPYGAPDLVNPFSLTVVVTVTHDNVFEASTGDANIEAVPEPNILALLGMTLLGFGLTTYRRRVRA